MKISRWFPIADALIAPLVFFSAWLLWIARRAGIQNLPICKKMLMQVGVFPIRNHYYEPQFDHRTKRQPFSQDRMLPGIDWNEKEQLGLLDRLSFADEISRIPQNKTKTLDFYMDNGLFGPGDAEYWYQIIRFAKPRNIVEIGSGISTLMTIKAIQRNREQFPNYRCKHVCVEPYENPWLEKTGATIVRQKAESVGTGFFSELQENDILFIDSSHIIRPQGDVLFVYLELLPALASGVIVHVHDIFSPKNYPARWLKEEIKFWNEQYLLEAFLSNNKEWIILGALNFLYHHHHDKLKAIAPSLSSNPNKEPGSFYLKKID